MTYRGLFFVALFSGILLLAATYPARISPLNIFDDPYYLKIAYPKASYFQEYENSEKYQSFKNFVSDPKLWEGRFRPLSLCFLWLIAKISSGNPLFIQLILAAWGILAAFLFYILLRQLKISVLTSILFTGIFLIGRYADIWYHRSAETFAIPFLLAGFVFFIQFSSTEKKIFGACSILAIAVSSLFKESFSVLIPAIAFGYVLLHSHIHKISFLKAFYETRILLFCCGVLFLTTAACVGIAWTDNADLHASSFSLKKTTVDFLILCGPIYFWIPVFAFAVHSLVTKTFRPFHLVFFLFGLSWILSQSVIYHRVELTPYGRYLAPAQLFPIFAAAICTDSFLSIQNKNWYRAIVCFFFFILALNIKNTYINSDYYSARVKAFHRMIDYIAGHSDDQKDKFILYSEEGRSPLLLKSIVMYLSIEHVNIPAKNIWSVEIRKDGKYLPSSHTTSSENQNEPLLAEDRETFFENIQADKTVRWIIFSTPVPNTKINVSDHSGGFTRRLDFTEYSFNSGIKDLVSSVVNGKALQRDSISYVMYER